MLELINQIVNRVKLEVRVWILVLKDSRTPVLAKVFLGIAALYAIFPFDILPDFIPVIGQVDDITLIALMIVLALKLIPKEVVDHCRIKATYLDEQ